MKKTLIIVITIILLIGFPAAAQAISPTPAKTVTPAPSGTLGDKLNNQINQLKEKIASRVAELNLVEKRGLIGSVTEVSGNKITLTDVNGKTRFVDVDEITKFSSASAKGSFGLSDLSKGTKISVLGLYNKESKRTLARYIYTSINPVLVSGTIADLDQKNYEAIVVAEDQKQIKVEIETTTKISVYSKTDGLSRYGFSKLSVGDRVVAYGYFNKKDPTQLISDRIIAFPDLPKNPRITVPQISEEPSPSGAEGTKTSTGSGMKVTPVTRTPLR